MSDCNIGVDFERMLAEERPRLVRLCAWFAHDADVAQDLAQETLIVAWKNSDQLISLDEHRCNNYRTDRIDCFIIPAIP